MITFGRKLKHLRQKNHLTQKELGIALGFSEDSADVRIAQYEADARKPRDEILVKMAKILCVPIDILTVDEYFYPAENIVKSIAHRQIETSFDLLSDSEFKIIQGTVDGILKSRESKK